MVDLAYKHHPLHNKHPCAFVQCQLKLSPGAARQYLDSSGNCRSRHLHSIRLVPPPVLPRQTLKEEGTNIVTVQHVKVMVLRLLMAINSSDELTQNPNTGTKHAGSECCSIIEIRFHVSGTTDAQVESMTRKTLPLGKKVWKLHQQQGSILPAMMAFTKVNSDNSDNSKCDSHRCVTSQGDIPPPSTTAHQPPLLHPSFLLVEPFVEPNPS